ncbi:MAG: glycosyltransferase family 1 protein [bacterium]|nr:glycosyltransferase family 1 protein [bacterium]
MRIGIDARFFGPIGKGLGRYTQKLIENLETVDNINQYFIFLKKENFDAYQPRNKNFTKVLADYHWYTFSEQIKMPVLLNKYKLDLVHFPHFNIPLFYRKKFIITVHDLILLHFPTRYKCSTLNLFSYWLKFIAYKIVIRRGIFKSSKIITVSNFTKKDILENYQVSPEKIVVTYEASDEEKENNYKLEEVLKKYSIFKPYILYVGNAYPHKNLERLILAFKKLKVNNNLKLVLVGKEDYFYQRLKNFVKKDKIKNIIFTDFVPDEELDVIYREALFFIFPSLYEGFGLPPLEAMQRGIPVVSSDHLCMKEILGESAYYFNARKKENIAKAIQEVSENQNLREDLIKKGLEQTKKYSFQKMAKETLKIYLS